MNANGGSRPWNRPDRRKGNGHRRLEERYERWKAEYDARQRDDATRRFLGEAASGRVHPEVERGLELHDFATRSREPLTLA